MTIDTNSLVSITEANQNFSKVARLVDEKGSAVNIKYHLRSLQVFERYPSGNASDKRRTVRSSSISAPL